MHQKPVNSSVTSLHLTYQSADYYLESWDIVVGQGNIAEMELYRKKVYSFMQDVSRKWMGKNQFPRLKLENQEALKQIMENLDHLHSHLFIYIRRAKDNAAIREELLSIQQPYDSDDDFLESGWDYRNWPQSSLEHSDELIRQIKNTPPPI